MKIAKVSVIIPVYNVEKYLSRCIDSVLAQSLTPLEVILIDDGSTDRSPKICDEYATNYDNIRVIHKKNGGLSSARNEGIKKATGEFLSFIDSDDYIEKDMLLRLYTVAKKHGSDISICATKDCYTNHENSKKTNDAISSIKEPISLNPNQALEAALIGNLYGMSVCSKIFKNKIFNKLKFELSRTSEDVFLTPQAIMQAQKVSYIPEQLYNYWHRAQSITTKPYSKANLDVIDGYNITLERVKQWAPELEKEALFRLYWAYFLVLDKIVLQKDFKKIPEYDSIIRFLKKNWLNILNCKYFQTSRRLSVIFLKINIHLYKKLVIIHENYAKINN